MQPSQSNPYGSAYGDSQAPVPQYGAPTTPGQYGPLQAYPQQAYPYGAGPHPLFGPSMPVPEQYAADYQASFGTAIKRFFQRGFTFKGYASRREFWLVALMSVIVYGVIMALVATMVVLGESAGPGGQRDAAGIFLTILLIAYMLFNLVMVVPVIAVGVRRLHDAGYPGLMYLINLVPFGGIVLLILYMQPTHPERWRAEWHM